MLNILVSFWAYRRHGAMLADVRPRVGKVFADSGAFSAYAAGAQVRIAEYVRWLHEHAGHVDVYANLDVIDDPVKSARNLAILEREGLAPLPVFHIGSEDRHLDAVLEKYTRFAIGGMVHRFKHRAWLRARLKQVFAKIPATAHVHGFGIGVSRLAERFPWSSVDSTAHMFAGKTRQLAVFDRKMKILQPPHETGTRGSDADWDKWVGMALRVAAKQGVPVKDLLHSREARLRSYVLELAERERAIQSSRPGFVYFFGVGPSDMAEFLGA